MKSFYDFYEEMMAAPTNSVGDGSKVALPPTHERQREKEKNICLWWDRFSQNVDE